MCLSQRVTSLAQLLTGTAGVALLHHLWSQERLTALTDTEWLGPAGVALRGDSVTSQRVTWPGLRGTCFAVLPATKVNVFVFLVTKMVLSARIMTSFWVT